MARHPKRQYSRAFTPTRGDGRALTIRRIPAPLLKAAQARAKREGRSIRSLILTHLAEYAGVPVEEPTNGQSTETTAS